MSANLDAFQALLAKMRDDFLAEIPERCDNLDELILRLEKSSGDQEAFNELYRGVHSLKGSGGTHGISIITTICHQLENLLTETNTKKKFDQAFGSRALAYVDLLRKVEDKSHQFNPAYAEIESVLDELRMAGLQSRKSVLIVESSKLMADLYQQSLANTPLQLSVEENGMTALSRLLHEPFDLVIVGRELKELNGISVVAALRSSQTRNQEIPAVLVSSKKGEIPGYLKFSSSILRDQNLTRNLVDAVKLALNY